MDQEAKPPRQARRSYCLRCFADLARDAERCEACGHVQRDQERRVYWTLHPRIACLQQLLAWAGFLLALAFLFGLVLGVFGDGWPGHGRWVGYAYALPIVAALLWWELSKLLLRHDAFAPRVFWFGFPPAALLVGVLQGSIPSVWWVYSLPALWIVAAYAVAKRFQAWKTALIQGDRTLATPSHSA